MGRHKVLSLFFVLCVALASGCRGKEQTPKQPEKPTEVEPVKAKVPSAAPTVVDEAPAVVDEAARANEVARANEAARVKAEALLASVRQKIIAGDLDGAAVDLEALDVIKGSLPAGMQDEIDAAHTSLDTARKAQESLQAGKEADSLLARIVQMIKDGNLDQADAQLKTLEAKMGSLPQPMQDRVKAARNALEAAKAAKTTIKKPELPSMQL
ncbi:MAG: hypothetical protein HQ546_11360 [Planctomycetes bacterium]|nr:hypothetical protein [Planctomycetota bacterium]